MMETMLPAELHSFVYGPAGSLELRVRSLLREPDGREGRLAPPLFLLMLAALFGVTILYLGYIC